MVEWKPVLKGKGPKYKALVDAITEDIESGTLHRGQRMPTHRDLAHRLGLSVQTVSLAYKEVERRGYLRSEVGRGTFVKQRLTDRAGTYMLDRRPAGLIDLSTARAVYTVAHSRLTRELLEEMGQAADPLWLRSCRPVAGFDVHREIGAQWLARFGLEAKTDQIIVTNGASQGLFLALATVVEPGDLVLTEDLTDHGIIGNSSILRFTLRGLRTDDEGLLPDALEEACASAKPKALICTPVFTNPTNTLMGEARRRQIAAIAQKHGLLVIENDVHRPLLQDSLPPIASLIPELSLYCTSFTKSVMTGLRAGYLVVPHRLSIRASSVLRVSAWMATPLVAEMATRWVETGIVDTLLKIQLDELRTRNRTIDRVLGDSVIRNPQTSLSAWIRVPEQWTEASFAQALRRQGVAVTTPDPFLVADTERPNAFRICVGGPMPLDVFEEALHVIARVSAQYPAIHDAAEVE